MIEDALGEGASDTKDYLREAFSSPATLFSDSDIIKNFELIFKVSEKK